MVSAYGARAAEYAAALGNVAVLSEADRVTIEQWALGLDGPILDLGCGPGQWTAHLRERGHDICGIDPAAEMVAIARGRHPHVPFDVGSVETLERRDLRGVLAWYSLIHHDPPHLQAALTRLGRAIRPSGSVLLGFFDGPAGERFDHAIAPAWYWDVPTMGAMLDRAGLTVLDCGRRTDPGSRPHAHVIARRPA